MNRKLPSDTFGFYFSLGAGRSYDAVAKRYQVSKRAVAKMAAKEKWQERLMEAEKKARDRTDEKVAETLDDMNARHIKVLRFIQGKAIDALKSMPLESAMDAVRAFTLSVQKERLIRGEPTDRNALDIEQLIKREYAMLMIDEPAKDNSDAA